MYNMSETTNQTAIVHNILTLSAQLSQLNARLAGLQKTRQELESAKLSLVRVIFTDAPLNNLNATVRRSAFLLLLDAEIEDTQKTLQSLIDLLREDLVTGQTSTKG
jgi:ABC-type sugar transport system ATPase subunit